MQKPDDAGLSRSNRILGSISRCWRSTVLRIGRYHIAAKVCKRGDLKINYGCGNFAQPGFVNVDVRWTPSVDLIADLEWCGRYFRERCSEVYLSHVLEHYAYPGKVMRSAPGTVLNALQAIKGMLVRGGRIRVAVPDFGALSRMYVNDGMDLFPRLAGRLCGEQEYPQNLHKCVFDCKFLTQLLTEAGFVGVTQWNPEEEGYNRDASWDSLNDVGTSLNLTAEKDK